MSYYATEPSWYYDPDPDEGILILQSAIEYLRPRWEPDEEDQETGDYESYAELDSCIRKIEADYQCHFCGNPIAEKKDRYCSKGCYQADMEGL